MRFSLCVLVLALASGCRLHFDETTDGGGVSGIGDGSTASSCIAETCNGLDDDELVILPYGLSGAQYRLTHSCL